MQDHRKGGGILKGHRPSPSTVYNLATWGRASHMLAHVPVNIMRLSLAVSGWKRPKSVLLHAKCELCQSLSTLPLTPRWVWSNSSCQRNKTDSVFQHRLHGDFSFSTLQGFFFCYSKINRRMFSLNIQYISKKYYFILSRWEGFNWIQIWWLCHSKLDAQMSIPSVKVCHNVDGGKTWKT